MNTPFKTLQDIDDFIDFIDECKRIAKTIHVIDIDPDNKDFKLIGSDRSYMISDGKILRLSV